MPAQQNSKLRGVKEKNIWLETSWLTLCIALPFTLFCLYTKIDWWAILLGAAFIWLCTFFSIKTRNSARGRANSTV